MSNKIELEDGSGFWITDGGGYWLWDSGDENRKIAMHSLYTNLDRVRRYQSIASGNTNDAPLRYNLSIMDACIAVKRFISQNMPSAETAKQKGIVFIYALVDPRNSEIRYIGKTNNLSRRYAEHVGNHCRLSCTNWIKELISLGLAPNIKLLLESDYGNWEQDEIDTIQKYSQLCNLTNISSGGDGKWYGDRSSITREKLRIVNIGRKHTSQARNKMSESKKAWWADHPNTHPSEEHKQHLREAQTGEKSIMSKPIFQFTTDGKFLRRWGSALEASRDVGVVRHAIHMCAEGFNKTSAGYVWFYESELPSQAV